MLEIRPNCENCNTSLPPNSEDAMICNFECTFCKKCVEDILQNVCPNCSGGFQKRPVRPKKYLEKYPPSEKIIYKPVNTNTFKLMLKKFKNIKPSNR